MTARSARFTSAARDWRAVTAMSRKQLARNLLLIRSIPERGCIKRAILADTFPDGQIAFAGRLDDQDQNSRLPHRAQRECVAALNSHPQIEDCVVVAHEEECREKRLLAYVISSVGALTHSAVREFLRPHIPEYMIPSAFVLIESFPLTPNGKIDVCALPAPNVSNTLSDPRGVGTASPVEQEVSAIVAELLGLPEISRDDNFFLLGGHSLLGAQLIARLRDAFGVNLALRTLLEASSIAGLAAAIDLQTRSGNAGQACTTSDR